MNFTRLYQEWGGFFFSRFHWFWSSNHWAFHWNRSLWAFYRVFTGFRQAWRTVASNGRRTGGGQDAEIWRRDYRFRLFSAPTAANWKAGAGDANVEKSAERNGRRVTWHLSLSLSLVLSSLLCSRAVKIAAAWSLRTCSFCGPPFPPCNALPPFCLIVFFDAAP